MQNSSNIGYTTAFCDDKLLKIEILGQSMLSTQYHNRHNNYNDYNTTNSSDRFDQQKATYVTDKFRILDVYDYKGNLVTNLYDDDMDCLLAKEKAVIDIGVAPYFVCMERGLEELRKDLFFNEVPLLTENLDIIEDIDSDDSDDFENMTICKRKKKFTFTGIQKIYDSDGIVVQEFYHNNGIKEGKYYLYRYFVNYIINFVNDKQVGDIEKYDQHIDIRDYLY
jgi:hypothetical protein